VLFDRLHAELQKDLAARVPGGRQVIAERSGHNVALDQPHVVVDAVMSVRG
jgi:pimeloyl-ACP methyl ester carboxylesterase